MDDHLNLFLKAQREFGERVHAVTEQQWRQSTPAAEWTVADLVGHLIDEHRWAAPLLHGQDLDSAAKIVQGARSLPVDGGVGANLAEEWDEAAIGSADAFAADGALARTVELSRGTTPVRDYIAEMIVDLVVHGWDLGTAIGYSQPLSDDTVAAAYAQVVEFGDLTGSGMFDDPIPVDDDASTIDKLVALTGRDPG